MARVEAVIARRGSGNSKERIIARKGMVIVRRWW